MNFEILFQNLIDQLKSSDKVESLSKYLKETQSVSKCFEIIWNDQFIQSQIDRDLQKCFKQNNFLKNDKCSEHYRKIGNDYYKKRELSRALMYYHKSLMAAEINVENKLSSCMALSYANISAVLYDMHLYDECLYNIHKSIYHGYPPILKPKLIERSLKCLLTCNKVDEATEILSEYEIEINKLDEIIQEKIKAAHLKMKNLLSSYEKDMKLNSVRIQSSNLSNNPPSIIKKHLLIPSMSDAIDLVYASEKGRHLIATRNIEPGKII